MDCVDVAPGACVLAVVTPPLIPASQLGRAADPERRFRLLEQVRARLRTRHYSKRTEATYVEWVRRFVLFHGRRHPRTMGEREIAEFLTHLATERRASASTQNQALAALLFLYRHVLSAEIGFVHGIVRAKRPQRLPVVLTPSEVRAVFTGAAWRAASLRGADVRRRLARAGVRERPSKGRRSRAL